ncbi:hypothetical protein GCM10009779_38370 [Polymorphospora rubra]|uniref:Uncharacterized protein n=1 Tax=Polymorphospora rubra TaxID=338584 RepID=A0A810N918_9ACTN|nr:hypothetical protein Prubr_65610 [Polymorphospora rubra]
MTEVTAAGGAPGGLIVCGSDARRAGPGTPAPQTITSTPISSVATRMANATQTSFAMTEGAVETMTLTLANQLRQDPEDRCHAYVVARAASSEAAMPCAVGVAVMPKAVSNAWESRM